MQPNIWPYDLFPLLPSLIFTSLIGNASKTYSMVDFHHVFYLIPRSNSDTSFLLYVVIYIGQYIIVLVGLWPFISLVWFVGAGAEIVMFFARLMAGILKPNSHQFVAPNVWVWFWSIPPNTIRYRPTCPLNDLYTHPPMRTIPAFGIIYLLRCLMIMARLWLLAFRRRVLTILAWQDFSDASPFIDWDKYYLCNYWILLSATIMKSQASVKGGWVFCRKYCY